MKLAWFALAALLVGCAPRGPDPEILQALANYDDTYERSVAGMKAEPTWFHDEMDFRGQTYEKEYARWAMTPETRRHLDALRELAENASSVHVANVHLGEARKRLAVEYARVRGINEYWTDTQIAPYWRKYWNALFVANEQPAASPDPMLLSIEARIREAFDRGDFQRAADEAKTLPPVLGEAMSRAAGNLIKFRKDKATFIARRTPCVPGATPDRTSRRPKIQPTEEIESFYPAAARDAGVQGTVVLSVNVDSTGCGREVALLVQSGVPELDQAALTWFETARFAPAWQDGGPVRATLNFKIRFKVEEPRYPNMDEVATADSKAPDAPQK